MIVDLSCPHIHGESLLFIIRMCIMQNYCSPYMIVMPSKYQSYVNVTSFVNRADAENWGYSILYCMSELANVTCCGNSRAIDRILRSGWFSTAFRIACTQFAILVVRGRPVFCLPLPNERVFRDFPVQRLKCSPFASNKDFLLLYRYHLHDHTWSE